MASEKKSQGEMASEKKSPKHETDSSDDDSSISSHVLSSQFCYGKCERNFSNVPGQIVLDGCQEFMPDQRAEEGTPGALFCDACGCHEFDHELIFLYVTKSP
ncbi:mini zinc finger protein 2 [Artemisia annua]|uniref:Mini zinc finger protein 2 n=1 Tax=Artemisia annua TaxID=35608 RepID=A0A2U1MS05_ARTAN|nr:mini zinc finger protein 2 [Artemisia annua]